MTERRKQLKMCPYHIPIEVDGTIAEVSHELGGTLLEGVLVQAPRSLVLILVGSLHRRPRGDHLRPSHAWDVVQCSESRWDVLGSRETYPGVGDEVSNFSIENIVRICSVKCDDIYR